MQEPLTSAIPITDTCNLRVVSPILDFTRAHKNFTLSSNNHKNPNIIDVINSKNDRIGLDIGGTLTKLVYSIGNRVFFEKFSTESVEKIFTFLENLLLLSDIKVDYMATTGGGSYKFYDQLNDTFTKRYGIKVIKRNEMKSLTKGLDFLINDISNEIFIMNHENEEIKHLEHINIKYPYILTNIGSGVSILKVDGLGKFERIGGSSLGGGSLCGLLFLLTECKDYASILKISEKGDNRNLDMLISDIYGTDYNKIGLKSTAIASSFGKMFKQKQKNNLKSNPNLEADIARSLIYAITNNIAQISYLNAKIHGVENIFFGGSYISGHRFIIKRLSHAIDFWSQGKMRAHFLKHDGYIGAIGSFLTKPSECDDLS